MRIKVDIKIFAMLLFFLLTGQGVIYALVLLFTFLHEMGHLLCGMYFGKKVQSITCMPTGFSIAFYPQKENKKGLFWVSFAGPLTNFFLAVLFLVFPFTWEHDKMIYINLLLGFFNLLPLHPLDGGRMLKAIFNFREDAEEIVFQVSNGILILLTMIASIAILYFQNTAIMVIIIYLWLLRIQENKRYQIKKKVQSVLEREKILKKQ